jgi:hypothetical protein
MSTEARTVAYVEFVWHQKIEAAVVGVIPNSGSCLLFCSRHFFWRDKDACIDEVAAIWSNMYHHDYR